MRGEKALLIVHAYFAVDDDEIWRTVERGLAPLKKAILEIIGK